MAVAFEQVGLEATLTRVTLSDPHRQGVVRSAGSQCVRPTLNSFIRAKVGDCGLGYAADRESHGLLLELDCSRIYCSILRTVRRAMLQAVAI